MDSKVAVVLVEVEYMSAVEGFDLENIHTAVVVALEVARFEGHRASFAVVVVRDKAAVVDRAGRTVVQLEGSCFVEEPVEVPFDRRDP